MYESLKRELLKAIRKNKSQNLLSKKMGFKFNQIYKWESGQTQIKWKEFIDLCIHCKIDIKKALKESFSFVENPSNSCLLVQHFCGQSKKKLITDQLNISRFTLSRWLSGQGEISLINMLALIDCTSPELFRFLEYISSIEDLPSIREQVKKDRKQLELFYSYPWLSAVLSALDLDSYKKLPSHSDSFISEKARLPLPTVQKTLGDLQKNQLIVLDGKHYKTQILRTSLRGSVEGRKKIAHYVNHCAQLGIEAGFGNGRIRTSWKTFSLNSKFEEQILQKYTEFFNELGTLIDRAQEGADQVYLFNMNFMGYSQIPILDEKFKPVP